MEEKKRCNVEPRLSNQRCRTFRVKVNDFIGEYMYLAIKASDLEASKRGNGAELNSSSSASCYNTLSSDR